MILKKLMRMHRSKKLLGTPTVQEGRRMQCSTVCTAIKAAPTWTTCNTAQGQGPMQIPGLQTGPACRRPQTSLHMLSRCEG